MLQPRLPECCCRCLAKETPKSWQIDAQTRDRLKDRDDTDLVTTYWVQLPLCAACHRHLKTVGYLFWVVGIMAGIVACGLGVQYAMQHGFKQGLDVGNLAASIGFAVVVVGIIAWG